MVASRFGLCLTLGLLIGCSDANTSSVTGLAVAEADGKDSAATSESHTSANEEFAIEKFSISRRDGANMQLARNAKYLNASRETLEHWKKDSHRDVALSAAWQEALRMTPYVDESDKPKEHPWFRRFVGFVDGRLPVEIPHWWEEAVVFARKTPDNEYAIFWYDEDSFPWTTGMQYYGQEFYAPKGVSGHRIGTKIEVSIGDKKYEIPSKSGRKRSGNILSPVVGDKAIFLVLGKSRDPGWLLSIDRGSGKILWESEIWANVWLSPLITSGGPYACIEPRIGRDGQVYVFGEFVDCVFIEAFSPTTGSPLFRFSTNY